jgi:hypothetical protein
MGGMLVHPPKASPGDRVAVVSAAFAAPAVGPAVHEQAMRRLVELTGLEPVEYRRPVDSIPQPRIGPQISMRRSPTRVSARSSRRSVATTR